MSIHEVRMGKEPIEASTFSAMRLKKIQSYLIVRQTRVFLKKGGKIKNDAIVESEYIPPSFNNSDPDQAARSKQKNRRATIKASMKSKFYPTAFESVYHSDANKDKFVFIVGKYISKQYDNVTQAVNGRDLYRKKLENA